MEGGQCEDIRPVTEKKARIQGLREGGWGEKQNEAGAEGRGNERGVHAQYELRTLYRRRIKGTEGVRSELHEMQRKRDRYEKGEEKDCSRGARAGCALRKSSL